MAPEPRYPKLEIEVHGPNVSAETTREVGTQMADLLKLVGEHTHGIPLEWTVSGVRFKCDGCGLTQPFDAPRDGWTHANGDDFCPACIDIDAPQ